MPHKTIDRLIINSPYTEPAQHWKYQCETRLFDLAKGRRQAGYVVASPDPKAFDDPGEFKEIWLVNRIRPRVSDWRAAGYPGVTSVTKRLLAHWNDAETFDARRFFFCQLEAIETLIWLTEAPAERRVGVDIPGDGGEFGRTCCKMATGSGKTIVMAMVIAWHLLNKATYPQDARFSKHVLVMAPGLTVKRRLEVLKPESTDNYYHAFDIVPSALFDKLRQGRVLVHNWHALAWDSKEQMEKRRSVDKRGVKSDEAYTREVLLGDATARNLLVINDEAHHAWRVNGGSGGEAGTNASAIKKQADKDSKDSAETATVWIGGLDRLHRSRGILDCYDFSATPFVPSGKKNQEEALFGWIVSDFGLNDAIESGLVKTPRVVVHDDALPDAKTYKSRLYHIYNDSEVKDDLNRKAAAEEPLPDLVRNAYYLLGYDWQKTWQAWDKARRSTPPVMITVCNRTETAARVKHAFDKRHIHIDELCDLERILHIDSEVLKKAEAREELLAAVDVGDAVVNKSEDANAAAAQRKSTKQETAELLRQTVDTIGKVGEPGENIQNVISVGMLNEGWDAKTVTHIMGLRAFSSQLLCEQVVGRGLRRTAYEVDAESGLFEAEYVNIFGVPFTFLPHESSDDGPPPPPSPKTEVRPEAAKRKFEIKWPNIVRIEHALQPRLSLDLHRTAQLNIDAAQTVQLVELAPTLDGKPDVSHIDRIALKELAQKFRTQRIVFETARDIFDSEKHRWVGIREVLLAQLVRIVETFIASDRIVVTPQVFQRDAWQRRLMITLNMSRVVRHIWAAVHCENTKSLKPVFDVDHPLRSTEDMRLWYTAKPCERTQRSHINVCVYDSTWEASDAFCLDNSEYVAAWAKNDHLGFEILYVYRGVVRKYRPDFLVQLVNGVRLVLETKGREREQDKVKQNCLNEWVAAVNADGGFGKWYAKTAKAPGEIQDILHELA